MLTPLMEELNRATTPVSRPSPLVVLWRWRYEAGALVGVPLTGHVLVDAYGPLSLALLLLPAAVTAWPPARTEAWGRIRCVVVAHRVRVGFAEAYVVSRRGKIPVVVWCAPTPYGERVGVWCRAGTTAAQIERGREVIAAACWAADVVVRPYDGGSHLVLLEIVRGASRRSG
ncbi:hypothetical protein [Nonomuraea indica]|uniref:Uncharacterized protein n=1 Tax=Nonomuraea indica TaxID=1581193 RepID=A0ABW8AF91_9ACTN